jgi:hypothetical protein
MTQSILCMSNKMEKLLAVFVFSNWRRNTVQEAYHKKIASFCRQGNTIERVNPDFCLLTNR